MKKLFIPSTTAITLLFLLLAGGSHAFAQQRQTTGNLLTNGNFEAVSGGEPNAWPLPDGATLEQEDDNHFLRLTPAKDKQMLTIYRVVPLKPAHKAMKLTFRARARELVRGSANWHDGRIILDFKNDEGEKLKPGPSHPSFRGTTDGWIAKELSFLVPEGATKLDVMPALFQVKSGSLDLDDFVLTTIDPEPIIAANEAAAKKKAEQIAMRAAKVKPQVPEAPADKLPRMLRVQGNKIVDSEGDEVWLQGVAIPSMEWSAGGENILESVRVAIDDWKVNVIRLPIKEHFWKGVGPWQDDGGAGYHQLVADVINLAGTHGVYVVIDLHRYRAPKQEHDDFWKAFAEKYQDHPVVLFDIYNEPHDVSWEVWRNGGFASTAKNQDTDALVENQQQLEGYESVGMQGLVDTVRATGAKNIIIAGGLDWGYDLSGVLDGYALDDRQGNGIVYSTHVYPWKSDWQGKFMEVAEHHPIFIGECGAPQQRLDFIPESRHEDPSTWVPDFLGLVQKHKYHWTGWAFHPKAAPVLLEDWDYTPSSYWGTHAKAALHGEEYEGKKLR